MKYSKYWLFLFAVILITAFACEDTTAQQADSVSTVVINYAVGADLSFLKSAEDRGGIQGEWTSKTGTGDF